MLPDYLDVLGSRLEAAAGRAMRRRSRRQGFLNAVGAVCLAVPLAVAVSAAPLAPSSGLPLGPMTAQATDGMSFMVAKPLAQRTDFKHIPDKPLPATKTVCLDARDCLSPYEPTLAPAPAGRV